MCHSRSSSCDHAASPRSAAGSVGTALLLSSCRHITPLCLLKAPHRVMSPQSVFLMPHHIGSAVILEDAGSHEQLFTGQESGIGVTIPQQPHGCFCARAPAQEKVEWFRLGHSRHHCQHCASNLLPISALTEQGSKDDECNSLGHMLGYGSLHEIVISKLAVQRCCCSPSGWRALQLGLTSHCRGPAQDRLDLFCDKSVHAAVTAQ